MSRRVDGDGVVIFLGPSLSHRDARAVLPAASYRPPIAQGDLLSLMSQPDGARPWAVGIVDGVFYQSLPVWHKEILHAVERGTLVFGASSMGALRAAECDRFGMIGVGEIYRRFADRELTDDDEVAIAIQGAEHGWRGSSEPLVNVRATCEAAVTAGRLSAAASASIVTAAKELWFTERTRDAILDAARSAGVSSTDVDTMREAFEHDYVDLKRADAVALLEAIRDAALRPVAVIPTAVARSLLFEALTDRDRHIGRGATTIVAEQIARHVALSHPEFGDVRDRALDRLLVEQLAKEWRVEADDDEIAQEEQRFRARRGLRDDASLTEWRIANDITQERFAELMETESRARKLRDWMAMCQSKRLLVEPVITELRLRGEYPRWVTSAIEVSQFGPEADEPATAVEEGPPLAALLRDQIRAGGWRPDGPLPRVAEEGGFDGTEDMVEEIVRHTDVRRMRRRAHQIATALFPDAPDARETP